MNCFQKSEQNIEQSLSNSLYDCKLPVEGKIYTNRGQAPASVVDN